MNSQEVLQLLISALVMGSITAYLAKRRGRDPVKWFFVGFFFGIFGLIALFFMKPVEALEPAPRALPTIEQPKQWYYLDAAHNTLGPITHDELQSFATPKTYVWKQGMTDWKRFEDT